MPGDPESDLDFEQAERALTQAGALDKPCPACDRLEWGIDHMRYVLHGLSGGDVIGDYGYAVLIVRCERCGFARLHSTRTLGI